jgi:hypothetical protein
MIPAYRPPAPSPIRFGDHGTDRVYREATQRAVDWTNWAQEVGLYEETTENGPPQYHIVSGPDLEAAQNRHQPDLVILKRHNQPAN